MDSHRRSNEGIPYTYFAHEMDKFTYFVAIHAYSLQKISINNTKITSLLPEHQSSHVSEINGLHKVLRLHVHQ